jgi:CRISPR-associated protein Cmr4
MELIYLYLIAPLHTGGATQEGNLLGIARESHTDLPYVPSSTIRGRLRASAPDITREMLFGTELQGSNQLMQGSIWIGDASILWVPVPSLSHGVVWVSSPMLLRRWTRFIGGTIAQVIPVPYSTNLKNETKKSPVYLKDAILKFDDLQEWDDYEDYIPIKSHEDIKQVMVLPDQHCATLIQMSLWRQVKIKLDEHKSVDGGFRYEEAIPPDTLMYFPWGVTSQTNGISKTAKSTFQELLNSQQLLQIGGQESLGRGFVQLSYTQGDNHVPVS